MSEKANKKDKRAKAKLLLFFLKGAKTFFAVSVISAGISALADMLTPQIIRMAIDNVIGGAEAGYSPLVMKLVSWAGGFEHIREHMWIAALAIMLVALVKVISQYTFRVYNTKGSETLVKSMRDKLYGHIEHLPFTWHRQNRTGDIIQRCTSDIETMRSFVSDQLMSIFRIAIMLILALVFMFGMNVKLTFIAIIPMPIIIGYSFIFHFTIEKQFRDCDENEGKLSAMVQENLTGVRVVRAFGRERYELDRFTEHNRFYTSLWVKVGRSLSQFWTTADFLSGMEVLLVVAAGAVMCVKGTMQAGEYVAFISYNAMLVWPIRQLGRMISELSKAGVSIERVQYIMNSKVEENPKDAAKPDMSGDIEFKDVRFGYEGCPEILHDINFTVKSGTTLGILGGTGSGKTTLMNLLDKLYDLPKGNGTISIGGVDIRTIDTHYLRHNIGIVLQEPFLFSRTIAENVGIVNENATMDDIRSAAKAACLDDTISGFAQGYDTAVGERGVTLSGGQKQRCAIARMLMQDTPIMILDDSLSAVDTETDAKIRAALEKRFGNATVIIISHRITTLSHTDKIVVLENGTISEQGTHEELRNAGGTYSRIYETQSGIEQGVSA